MKLTIALPPGWRRDLGSLSMLAALGGALSLHQVAVLAPVNEWLTPQELRQLGATDQAADLIHELDPLAPQLLIIPVSAASAPWAAALLQFMTLPSALFVASFDTTPPVWPELVKQASGVLLCEERWHDLLHTAKPHLPLLQLHPLGPCRADRVQRPDPNPFDMPYLVAWEPATATSVTLVAEAFALLAQNEPALQLVVLDGAGCAAWERWSRALGIVQRCWLLGPEAYSQAEAIMAHAVATIAPLSPPGCSGALWSAQANLSAAPHVALTSANASWVSLLNGVPQVPSQAHDAARTLAQTLHHLMRLDVATAQAHVRLRHAQTPTVAGDDPQRLNAFLEAAIARHILGPGAFDHDNYAAYYTSLAVEALAGLRLDELAPMTVRDIAQSIAGLAK